MKEKWISIGSKRIGLGYPCFIIAEAGVNHNGSVELAKKLIDSAKEAGADAVKFQTFISENLVSETAKKADYQNKNDQRHETQIEMLRSLELRPEDFRDLKAYCEEIGIMFLSTPFDLQSVDLLESLGIDAYKIPSGEITNIQLIEKVSKKGKPIILSTGMANMKEITRAIMKIKSAGNDRIALLQCTTSYPAQPESLNLRVIQTFAKKFRVPVGLSDHSEGITAPIAAIALGACIIEKHFTLDRTMEGPDHKASLEPKELKRMIDEIRITEKMLGTGEKKPQEIEKKIVKYIRKGLFAAEDINAGDIITVQKIVAKRPLIEIPSEKLDLIVGSKAKIPFKKGSPLTYGGIIKNGK